MLTQDIAEKFAAIALGHLTREYPNKLDHVMVSDVDVRSPKDLHPIFYGSFDWHSCVHGYWLLAELLRWFPIHAQADATRTLFDEQFTPEKGEAEAAYMSRPASRGFERPYGWAWLLALQANLIRQRTPKARDTGSTAWTTWARSLGPLESMVIARLKEFLPKADYPIRAGAHGNTAFALRMFADYVEATGDPELSTLIEQTARRWYGSDRDCQAWEPSGDDFLSSALIEAECMRCVLDATEFRTWFDAFLPRVDERKPTTLFTPAKVSDRTDGKIAHLDGLNLSRAWCWHGIASAVEEPARSIARDAARVHLDASLPHVAGDYMGEHWLATFAMLALTAGVAPPR
ncbi:MAG TPA: DUF2891 domain-containing protein [Caulobacteraceae bacterium]|jgi:hypothetical protein|nr:DUF2891 domain-containing protein [Caulobacteraceae bacterium]